jgi:hypothetical protein
MYIIVVICVKVCLDTLSLVLTFNKEITRGDRISNDDIRNKLHVESLNYTVNKAEGTGKPTHSG